MNKFVQSGRVKTVQSSVLNPVNSGLKLIVNLCSQTGKFEQELDKALTKKWARVREDYKTTYATQTNCKLGSLVDSSVSSDTWVMNMIVRNKEDVLDEAGLTLAVKNLAKLAKYEKASVHVSAKLFTEVPKFKELIDTLVVAEGIHLYVYDETAAK
jgi:hypothetical protein